MADIILAFAIFVLGYMVGELVFIFRLRKLFHKIGLSDQIIELEKTTPKVSKLFIEQEKETYYLYDFEANKFLCQGSSIEELASLAQKYNNIDYAAVLYGDQMLTFVNGSVTEKT